MSEKKTSTPRYTRVWLVVVMIVCKRTVHSWSVLCPSFSLLRCPHVVFTLTRPPTSSALLFAYFFSTRMRSCICFLLILFSLSVCLSLSLSLLCYATLWSNSTSIKSAIIVVFRVRKRRKKEDSMLA